MQCLTEKNLTTNKTKWLSQGSLTQDSDIKINIFFCPYTK